MEGFFTKKELNKIGFKSIGKNVLISRKASIYCASSIAIGNNVRIDDFALLIGNIEIHDFVHIGAFCGLHASQSGKIIFEDYSGISSNVHIYASSDSFDGEYPTARPGISKSCFKTRCSIVTLGKYSQIGTGSTVIPGGNLAEGTAVGAMSLINKPLDSWSIYFGVPCKFQKKRSNNLVLKLAEINKKNK